MKINYLLLMFCIVWSNLSANNNNFDKNNISYKSISVKALDGYIDIINQYTEALTDSNYIELIINPVLIEEFLNVHLLMDFYNYNDYGEFGIYYALGDIDKNGIPELFIGGSYVTEVPRLYDIFVFDKTKAIKPFTELYYDNYGDFGNRCNIYLLQGGVIDVAWTNGGADSNGRDFYKISWDGYSMEPIDNLSSAVRMTLTGDGRTVRKYYHDKTRTIEISEAEFHSILEGYGGDVSGTLSWIEIKP